MWATYWHLHVPRASRARTPPAVSMLRIRLLWWDISSPFTHALTVGLLWQTQAPSYTHSQLQPGPHSSRFMLSLLRQHQSSPRVCLLKLEFQHPAPRCTSRWASQDGECSEVARTGCAGLCSACCKPVAALFPESLKRPIYSADLPASEGGSQSERTFFLSQLPPRGIGPVPILFFFFFSPTALHGDLS